ncbi:uncharacterized protein LOC120445783 [Drosophila santomea]|uniref:uncharacterized protein LOC120445783 n=1 Tax=Drosophila santomea TaxID=129105 RepID=UPI001953E54B|nr:uncharacterized protein LOC120445783 [Drosophila santomea]
MSSALMLAVVPLILHLMGVAVGAPASTSPAKPKLNSEIEVTTKESPTDSSTITSEPTSGLSAFEKECQFAWKKFLVDFDVHYDNNSELQMRRKVFCGNWQKVSDHNLKYDLGVVSFRKGINQFSDLTFEEWKEKQTPRLKPEITGELSMEESDKLNGQAAWEKLLIDFGENVKYEKWAEPLKKDIKQLTDLYLEDRPSPATEIFKKETTMSTMSKIAEDDIKCQAAWEKFLIDFKPKYQDDNQAKKRRNIFCDNWNSIQMHNVQYDLGNISFKKGINQWSDLTVEEWKNKQRPAFNPEFSEVETTTKISKDVKGQCQAAWKKFLVDFKVKYQDDAETEKRRNIFCDNWKAIQEHNVQFDLGVESFKKGINQWSDLTVEEWKNKQRPNLAPEH